MNPLSKFVKPKAPPAQTASVSDNCFCRACKVHWTHPKVFVSATEMPKFPGAVVWLCINCTMILIKDSKAVIPEVHSLRQQTLVKKIPQRVLPK